MFLTIALSGPATANSSPIDLLDESHAKRGHQSSGENELDPIDRNPEERIRDDGNNEHLDHHGQERDREDAPTDDQSPLLSQRNSEI